MWVPWTSEAIPIIEDCSPKATLLLKSISFILPEVRLLLPLTVPLVPTDKLPSPAIEWSLPTVITLSALQLIKLPSILVNGGFGFSLYNLPKFKNPPLAIANPASCTFNSASTSKHPKGLNPG